MLSDWLVYYWERKAARSAIVAEQNLAAARAKSELRQLEATESAAKSAQDAAESARIAAEAAQVAVTALQSASERRSRRRRLRC